MIVKCEYCNCANDSSDNYCYNCGIKLDDRPLDGSIKDIERKSTFMSREQGLKLCNALRALLVGNEDGALVRLDKLIEELKEGSK